MVEHLAYCDVVKRKRIKLPFILCFKNKSNLINELIVQNCNILCSQYRNIKCYSTEWFYYQAKNKCPEEQCFEVARYNGKQRDQKANGLDMTKLKELFIKLENDYNKNISYMQGLSLSKSHDVRKMVNQMYTKKLDSNVNQPNLIHKNIITTSPTYTQSFIPIRPQQTNIFILNPIMNDPSTQSQSSIILPLISGIIKPAIITTANTQTNIQKVAKPTSKKPASTLIARPRGEKCGSAIREINHSSKSNDSDINSPDKTQTLVIDTHKLSSQTLHRSNSNTQKNPNKGISTDKKDTIFYIEKNQESKTKSTIKSNTLENIGETCPSTQLAIRKSDLNDKPSRKNSDDLNKEQKATSPKSTDLTTIIKQPSTISNISTSCTSSLQIQSNITPLPDPIISRSITQLKEYKDKFSKAKKASTLCKLKHRSQKVKSTDKGITSSESSHIKPTPYTRRSTAAVSQNIEVYTKEKSQCTSSKTSKKCPTPNPNTGVNTTNICMQSRIMRDASQQSHTIPPRPTRSQLIAQIKTKVSRPPIFITNKNLYVNNISVVPRNIQITPSSSDDESSSDPKKFKSGK